MYGVHAATSIIIFNNIQDRIMFMSLQDMCRKLLSLSIPNRII